MKSYDAMHNCMLAKQNNFARSTNEPFPLIFPALLRLAEGEFLNCTANCTTLAFQGCTNIMMAVDTLLKRNRARLKQCMF